MKYVVQYFSYNHTALPATQFLRNSALKNCSSHKITEPVTSPGVCVCACEGLCQSLAELSTCLYSFLMSIGANLSPLMEY